MNYLIIGKAKTGTTAISKIIANSIPGSIYHLEPKELGYFECHKHDMSKNHIVKIIYEHWAMKPRSRNAIIYNELSMRFNKRVFIVRDPRDEIISRVLYLAYPWAMSGAYEEEKFTNWIQLLKTKESNPTSVSFFDLLNAIKKLFGADLFSQLKGNVKEYYDFIRSAPRDTYIARYEDFVSGSRSGLENYLELDLPKDVQLDGLERTKRSSSFNNWKEVFLQEDVKKFRDELGALTDLYGYKDWEILPSTQLDSAYYSDYVCSIVRKVPQNVTNIKEQVLTID